MGEIVGKKHTKFLDNRQNITHYEKWTIYNENANRYIEYLDLVLLENVRGATEKGKPFEKGGRKAEDLRHRNAMMAGLPGIRKVFWEWV